MAQQTSLNGRYHPGLSARRWRSMYMHSHSRIFGSGEGSNFFTSSSCDGDQPLSGRIRGCQSRETKVAPRGGKLWKRITSKVRRIERGGTGGRNASFFYFAKVISIQSSLRIQKREICFMLAFLTSIFLFWKEELKE